MRIVGWSEFGEGTRKREMEVIHGEELVRKRDLKRTEDLEKKLLAERR